jgi:hypothetical protein
MSLHQIDRERRWRSPDDPVVFAELQKILASERARLATCDASTAVGVAKACPRLEAQLAFYCLTESHTSGEAPCEAHPSHLRLRLPQMAKSRSILLLAAGLFCIFDLQVSARTLVMDHIVIGLEPGTNAESCFGAAWPLAHRLFGDWYTLSVQASSAEDIFTECDRWRLNPSVRYAEPDWINDWWITPPFPPQLIIVIPAPPFVPPVGPVSIPPLVVPLPRGKTPASLPHQRPVSPVRSKERKVPMAPRWKR